MIKLIFIVRKQHLPSDAAILGKASKYHVTVKVSLQNALKSESSRELKPPVDRVDSRFELYISASCVKMIKFVGLKYLGLLILFRPESNVDGTTAKFNNFFGPYENVQSNFRWQYEK